eukprot:TRINITY_DN48836_c0_g1_i2.p1 TRINITY_DN48836_c0_g1~~TRINITY_DN48836_c0_g1_i2.p1  ORF type:complete len:170 (+),score=31.34 TRINITY_DN48836_c0_g1_i2:57-566(+)
MVISARRSWLQSSAIALAFALVQYLGALAGFGTPVFIFLCIIAMYRLGTREKWSDDGPSAYSIFNEGQESLLGTMTADELDKNLRGGLKRHEEIHGGSSQGVGGKNKSALYVGKGHALNSNSGTEGQSPQGRETGTGTVSTNAAEERRRRAAEAALLRRNVQAENKGVD